MDEKDQLPLPLPSQSAMAGEQAKELTEVAKLSAEVIELGLIREGRPVFVYDKKLALEKKGNAGRQEKHREEKAKQGLKMGFAPIAALEKVKELGGGPDGWARYMASLSNPGNATQEVLSGGGLPVVERIEVPVEVIKEIFVEKIVEKEVIKEVPGPERIVEKAVIKLTAEQKKTLALGEKVQLLKGWRLKIVRILLGFSG